MTSPLRKLIARLAGRTTGVATDEVPGYTTQQVGVACWKMEKAGDLHKAKLQHNVRYFTNPGLRDALMERVRTNTKKQGYVEDKPLPGGRASAPWGPETPAIETERTVYTSCPAFEPPYQREVSMANVYGGNQRGRVYLGAAG